MRRCRRLSRTIVGLGLGSVFLVVALSCGGPSGGGGTAVDTQGFTSSGGYDSPTFMVFSQEYNTDPEIGKWLRTKDFRVALSLAIDRKAINEIVYRGTGTPGNWLTKPSSEYHPGSEWVTLDAVRDVGRANSLLDELGLVDSDGDGLRDRPDGTGPLVFSWEVGGGFGVASLQADVVGRAYNTIADLIKTHWREIGIGLDWTEGRDTFQKMKENKLYIGIHSTPYAPEPWRTSWFRLVPISASTHFAPEIGRFLETNGLEGMAPSGPDPAYQPLAPDDTYPADSTGALRRMQELWQEGLALPEGDAGRVEIAQELFKIASEEKYTFGLVAIE